MILLLSECFWTTAKKNQKHLVFVVTINQVYLSFIWLISLDRNERRKNGSEFESSLKLHIFWAKSGFSETKGLYSHWLVSYSIIPAGIYLFKVNNGNTRKTCEICSKLTIKMVPLLLNLNIFHTLYYFTQCFYCRLWTNKWRLGLVSGF